MSSWRLSLPIQWITWSHKESKIKAASTITNCHPYRTNLISKSSRNLESLSRTIYILLFLLSEISLVQWDHRVLSKLVGNSFSNIAILNHNSFIHAFCYVYINLFISVTSIYNKVQTKHEVCITPYVLYQRCSKELICLNKWNLNSSKNILKSCSFTNDYK